MELTQPQRMLNDKPFSNVGDGTAPIDDDGRIDIVGMKNTSNLGAAFLFAFSDVTNAADCAKSAIVATLNTSADLVNKHALGLLPSPVHDVFAMSVWQTNA